MVVFGFNLLVACFKLLLGDIGALFGIFVSGILLIYVHSQRGYYR